MLRTLAIDFGSKRVGLALSDPLGFIAQPLGFLQFTSQQKFMEELKRILKERSVQLVLLGFPKNMDGTLGPKAEECLALSKLIERECGIEVQLWDERLTTKESEKILVDEFDLSREKRKKVRDSMAASLILRSYMDSQSSKKI